MEFSRKSSQAQWYASIATMANLAEYGLEFYRRGESRDKACELTQKGIELCEILVEGTELTGRPQVSPQQLSRLKAIEPLLHVDFRSVDDIRESLKVALTTLNSVKRDLDTGQKTVNDASIEQAQQLLRRVGQAFSVKAFATVSPRENRSAPAALMAAS